MENLKINVQKYILKSNDSPVVVYGGLVDGGCDEVKLPSPKNQVAELFLNKSLLQFELKTRARKVIQSLNQDLIKKIPKNKR